MFIIALQNQVAALNTWRMKTTAIKKLGSTCRVIFYTNTKTETLSGIITQQPINNNTILVLLNFTDRKADVHCNP